MPEDSFRNPHWYPTKPNGFVWELPAEPNEDQFFRPDEIVIDNGDGSYSFASTEGLRPSLVRDTSWDRIGCDMRQDDAEAQKFGWKKNTDFLDIEFKFWAKITGGQSDKFMSPEMVTGRHSSEPCCEGSSYGFNFDYNNNPLRIRPFKEQYHSEYAHLDWRTNTQILNAKVSGIGRFIGFGVTRFNKSNDQGSVSVILEAWINPDPEANPANWQKFTTVEDKGGWGDRAGVCNANNPDQILTWAMPVGFRLKIQDPSITFKFKNMSFREISPFGTFTDNNPVPAPQFGFSELFVKRHINTERTSACAVGSDVLLYSMLTENGDTNLSGTSYEAGEIINKTQSGLYNSIIKSGFVFARKQGSGATLNLRIRKATDGYASIVRTLGTWNAGDIGTSVTSLPFTDAGNTYRMQLYDLISLESDGTSSNYIAVFRDTDAPGDNTLRFTSIPNFQVVSGHLSAIISGSI